MKARITRQFVPSFAALLTAAIAASALAAEPVPGLPLPTLLWPKGAPGATGDFDEDKPAIYSFLPSPEKNTGASILVCPGGGFTNRAMDYEGIQICQWLKARGIAAFALRYRIRPLYQMRESLQDAHRAMQYLRAHADELKIAQDRIGMIGFSAGAQLVAAATFNPVAAKADAEDPLDRFPSRANFLILAYGSAQLRPQGTDAAAPPSGSVSVPPTFMFCTGDDTGGLNGMMNLYTSLRAARQSVEVHVFRSGEHGVGFAQGDPVLGAWPELLHSWMRAGGFLTGQERVPLKGLVKLDGEPLPRGAIVLHPIDKPASPAIIGYIFNTTPVRGQFNLTTTNGPVPGRYRVEIRQDATRWLSNSVNPMVSRFSQLQNGTDEQKKEVADYAHKRDLSPSIEDQRVYKKARPGDAQELVLEVKPGGQTDLNIEVFSK